MAKRRQAQRKKTIPPDQAVGAAAIFGILYVALNNLSEILWAVLLGSVGLIAFIAFRYAARKADRASLEERLADLLDCHESALISYYHQSRREDLFGNCDESRWHERIDTFLKTQLVPGIADYAAWRGSEFGRKAASAVDRVTTEKIELHRQSNSLAQIDAFDLTPIEYEHYCADLLRERGWSIQLTPATRDGGADFVAEKGSFRVVVQCKRYSLPVGNKAVQEVTSAVQLYNGNVACVVAPSGYTRQAQSEATGLSVHLLHHSALPAFADRLAG